MEYKRVSLQKDQIAKVIEMLKYIFPEATVNSTDGVLYQLTLSSSNNTCRSYVCYHLFEVLVYIIPLQLEMDFVVIDPYDMQSLYNQVVDRFDRLNDKEESAHKIDNFHGHYHGGDAMY